MISKYFLWTSVLIATILLFSSCLNSSDNNNIEYPTDPQIYAISISSRADTASLLSGVVFTIDQVKGEIFNREPLPYLFHVDSIMLNITNSNNYYSFTRIEITLDQESPYTWNMSDSIAISSLRQIKTTAPDGVTTKTYDFQLNIYQEDPYIISWEKIGENHITPPVEDQRTIALNDSFFTYYLSGTEMKAVSAPISATPAWGAVNNLSGMPHTLRLSSIVVSGNAICALDAATGWVYRSSDGIQWDPVTTEAGYEVVALYGELPLATPEKSHLLAVEHDGKLKFARANDDFSDIDLMNDVPANIPVTGFSAMKIESASSYATKFIYLSGGMTAGNTPNNDIWILEEDEDIIKYIMSKRPAGGNMQGSSLFFYDDKPYLIASSDGENLLMYSGNYGVDWVEAEENQAFPTEPDEFTGRTNASVITDDDNYIWIFGGISSSSNTQIVDIWRGRLNKFASN